MSAAKWHAELGGMRNLNILPLLLPQTKLTQARQKAEAIANQEDVPMKSKMREIEKLYVQVRGAAAAAACQQAGRLRDAQCCLVTHCMGIVSTEGCCC